MDPAASNESLESEGQASSCGSSMKDQLPSTIQGRLDRAKQLKGEGNKCFKEKDWKRAIKKYHHALMYCKGITDKLDFIPGMAAAGGLKATEEEEREATAVTVAVTNNLAGVFTVVDYIGIFTLSTRYTVKPLIKDTPKEDKPPNKGKVESTLAYTKITSERGQPLYKEQNGWSRRCPY